MFSGCFDYCNICFGELQYKSVITLTDLSLNIAPDGSIKHLSGIKARSCLAILTEFQVGDILYLGQ